MGEEEAEAADTQAGVVILSEAVIPLEVAIRSGVDAPSVAAGRSVVRGPSAGIVLLAVPGRATAVIHWAGATAARTVSSRVPVRTSMDRVRACTAGREAGTIPDSIPGAAGRDTPTGATGMETAAAIGMATTMETGTGITTVSRETTMGISTTIMGTGTEDGTAGGIEVGMAGGPGAGTADRSGRPHTVTGHTDPALASTGPTMTTPGTIPIMTRTRWYLCWDFSPGSRFPS